jgi:hypothetical protein
MPERRKRMARRWKMSPIIRSESIKKYLNPTLEQVRLRRWSDDDWTHINLK